MASRWRWPRSVRTQHQVAVILLWKLNPIIRGWANYNRTAVASRLFNKLDDWMFRRALRYAKHTHPKKSWKWVCKRYWGRWNKERGRLGIWRQALREIPSEVLL